MSLEGFKVKGAFDLSSLHSVAEGRLLLKVMKTFSNNTSHNPPTSESIGGKVILQILYCFTFAAITIINSVLLWRLFSKLKKTRSNILFIFLSVSDIFVAVISIPVLALAVFKTDFKDCLIPCDAFIVLHYFPYAYSWSLTITIALDRCLVITKKYAYVKAISKKRLMTIALILLVVEAGVSFVFSTVEPSTRIISQFVIEVISILITISSYLYLLHYVRQNTKNVTTNQKIKGSTNARLTKVIAYIFFCQVALTLPQWINLLLIITSKEEITFQVLRNRRTTYRWMMILRFQNSYLNACILLYNQYKDYKMLQRRNDESQVPKNSRSMESSNNTSFSTSTMKSTNRLSTASTAQL